MKQIPGIVCMTGLVVSLFGGCSRYNYIEISPNDPRGYQRHSSSKDLGGYSRHYTSLKVTPGKIDGWVHLDSSVSCKSFLLQVGRFYRIPLIMIEDTKRLDTANIFGSGDINIRPMPVDTFCRFMNLDYYRKYTFRFRKHLLWVYNNNDFQ